MADSEPYGVEVAQCEITLSEEAARRCAGGPWNADVPVAEIFELGDRCVPAGAGAHSDAGDDAEVWDTLAREWPAEEQRGQPSERAQRGKLLARITRGIDAVRAASLVERLSKEARTEMMSAGVQGVGPPGL